MVTKGSADAILRIEDLPLQVRGEKPAVDRFFRLWSAVFSAKASVARSNVLPHGGASTTISVGNVRYLHDDNRSVSGGGPHRVETTDNGYIISARYATARIESLYTQLGFNSLFWQQDLVVQRHFVLISVLATLQKLDHYSLHASSLAYDGRAILASGPSGSGKTTLALGLLEQGWHYLSDDVTLLSTDHEGETQEHCSLRAKALTKGFSCTDEALSRFTYLADAPVLFRNAKDKRVVDITELYPDQLTRNAPVGLILFPRVARTSETRLERLEPSQALLRLIPQTAGIKQRSQQVLGQLTILVRQAPAYVLYLGYDLYSHPLRVAKQIQGALADEF